MKIDNVTRFDMFEVLRDKVVATGSPPKVIRFLGSLGETLCEIDFEDIVKDTHIPGEFYFEDLFGSRIIKDVSVATGTVEAFEIYDDAETNIVISGTVTLLNAGGDIEFNAIDWTDGQAVILSSLKIVFPTE